MCKDKEALEGHINHLVNEDSLCRRPTGASTAQKAEITAHNHMLEQEQNMQRGFK